MKNLNLKKLTIGLIILLSILAITSTVVIAAVVSIYGQEIHSFLTEIFTRFAQTKIYNIFM